MNLVTKWLGTPVAHIATASVIASGMFVAIGIKLLWHNQHTVSIVLGVAIAGASVPLFWYHSTVRSSSPRSMEAR